ncbi:hypothetical protein LNO81_13615 [Klebsiella variicola subsp. variicola]|nr:hypothetical protein [Klebsiella variicola subsp. variicola]
MLVEGSLGGEHVPLVGFMLTLAAALSWACGNIFNKKIMSHAARPPIMSLVVWSALIPVLPFMLASWLIDGPQTMLASLQHIDLLTIPVAALSGVYRHYRRLWYLGIAAGALWRPGGWRRCRCWCRWWGWPALRCCWGRR